MGIGDAVGWKTAEGKELCNRDGSIGIGESCLTVCISYNDVTVVVSQHHTSDTSLVGHSVLFPSPSLLVP